MSMLRILSLLLLAAAVTADDKTMTVDDVTVQVVGRSGKIKLWRGDKGDDGKIFIDMHSLQEVDSSGNTVGDSGNPKHSFNSFASQDFTFSALATVIVPNSDNVSAQHFSFDSQLKDLPSTIKVDAYLLRQDGNITIDGARREVYKGQLKFSITLEDWAFCGDPTYECKKGNQDEVGESVDFTIEIKPTGGGDNVDGDGENKWDLGEGSNILLSNRVKADTVWEHMAQGFPRYHLQGAKKHQFTFRFPKFINEAFYDPDITIGQGGAPTTVATITTLVAAFIASRVFLW